jgi:hypothetical protein
VRENPQRSAEFAIGGGIALGGGALLGTAATRGATGAARGARSILDDIDIGSDARRFAADDRGQLDFTFGDSDTDSPTVEIDEPDDFDPQRVTDREVFDAPEAGPRRPDASFSQSFTQRTAATRRSDVPDRFDRGESAAEANPSASDRATFDTGPTISRDAVAPDVDLSDAAPAVRRQAEDLGILGGGAATGAAVGAAATVPPDPIDAARFEGLSDGATEDTTLSRSLATVDVAADTQQRLERAQSAGVGVDSDVDVGARSGLGIDTDVVQAADTRQTGLTDQLLDQEQALATSGVEVGTTTTRPVSQSTQTAPRTPTTTRLRPDLPDLPDFEDEEERAGLGLGAIGANFENPTRTLTEADELVTEIGEGFDDPR